ncbi:MAG: AbiEi antitoxin N-terminal domain-containing protein, partial [Imperialibacter sp.]
MSTDKQAKINQLLKILPHGVAITSLWLTRQGYSLDLQKRYRKSGWLESIGTGAMKRSGEKLTLEGGIYALQKQLNLSVHPGGKTALSMQGSSHYLQFSTSKTHLFGPARQTLPKWFKDYAWESPILYHTNNLFSSDVGMAEVQLQSFEIKVSNSARALMECLYLYPESQDLSECLETMESLNNLRPDTVSTLLE